MQSKSKQGKSKVRGSSNTFAFDVDRDRDRDRDTSSSASTSLAPSPTGTANNNNDKRNIQQQINHKAPTSASSTDTNGDQRLRLIDHSPLLSTSHISQAASRLSQNGSVQDIAGAQTAEQQQAPATIKDQQQVIIEQQLVDRSDRSNNRYPGNACCLSACCCCCSDPNSTMPKQANLVLSLFLAELIGTFILVIVGDGTIAAHVVTKQNVDMLTVCLGFGVGAMIASFASAKISGAHLNPAATLAFALDGKLSWCLVPVYMCAQYLGGFLAALMLYVNYHDAIKNLDGGQLVAESTGKIFATYPGTWLTSPWPALLDQTLGTAILLFAICAIADKQNSGLEERHQPLIVALIIGLVCVAFSPNCGAIFNPARDLAPRLLTWVVGYSQVWSPINGYYWLVAGVAGPHCGAIIGVFAYKLIIGCGLEKKRQLEDVTNAANQQQQQQTFKVTTGLNDGHTNSYGSGTYAMR